MSLTEGKSEEKSMPRPSEGLFMPRAVIFDCDGVLLNSYDATIYFYNCLRRAVGLPELNLEEEAFVFAAAVEDGLKKVFPENLVEKAREAQKTVSLEDYVSRLRLQPGILDLVGFLREKGLPLGVNTNGGAEVGPVFEAMGLAGLFDRVVTAADVVRPKPHPEGVQSILESWGLSPGEVVYVGDSSVDEVTARSAGLHFWVFRNPDLMAEHYIEDYHELIRELAELAAE